MVNSLCLMLAAMVAFSPQQSASAQSSGTVTAAAAPESELAASPLDPDDLPVSIEKIQRALARKPAIRVTEQRPVFRIEIFGRKPSIEEILGPDFLRGPVARAGMTHQEFLNMVTPKDVQGYAAFDNKQGAIVAITSFAFQYALAKAIKKFNEAKKEREREDARQEVAEALAALREARRKAGLPDK
jgi:hypothetical protein